jgi:hypothetical protein
VLFRSERKIPHLGTSERRGLNHPKSLEGR